VRGYKAGLLTQANYNNLTQCENLEGVWSRPGSKFPSVLRSDAMIRLKPFRHSRLPTPTLGDRLWQLLGQRATAA
jgi:hypothetical protein